MPLLMEDYVLLLPFAQGRGQIDFRQDNSHYKGRSDAVGKIDIIPQQHRAHKSATQSDIGNDAVNEHDRNSRQPYKAQPLGGFKASRDQCIRLPRRGCIHDVLVDLSVREGFKLEARQGAVHHLHGDRFHSRHGADRRFNAERAKQAQQHHSPQGIRNPLGRFFQQQTCSEHHGNDNACGFRHVHYLHEQVFKHHVTPSSFQ